MILTQLAKAKVEIEKINRETKIYTKARNNLLTKNLKK